MPLSQTIIWPGGETSQTTTTFDPGFAYSVFSATLGTTTQANGYYGTPIQQEFLRLWSGPGGLAIEADWQTITSYTNVYDTGTLASATDPLGNTTNYSYSPTFYGAYVTQTTYPVTSGVSHIINGNYDFNTGLLSSSRDMGEVDGSSPSGPTNKHGQDADDSAGG